MQLCIEPVDQAGGCGFGYSCAYTDTISWASPTRPLPMVRDPRSSFDTLFGALGRARRPQGAASGWRRTAASSTGCASLGAAEEHARPADRARLDDYLENVREIERRIRNIEAL